MSKASLPDIQNQNDPRELPLKKVGIKKLVFPFFVDFGDGKRNTPVECDLLVNLPAEKKGINMSRPVEALRDLSLKGKIKPDLRNFLKETLQKVGGDTIYATFSWLHFINKKSPKTDSSAPMGYRVRFEADFGKQGRLSFYDTLLEVRVLANNCCPCSKAISEGGAHNQRIEIIFQGFSEAPLHPDFSIEALIHLIESSASCPLYPILKRLDEKHVTETQYQNPKFVEDVLRDALVNLKPVKDWGFLGFKVSAEAQESIHAHNAYAEQEVFFTEE